MHGKKTEHQGSSRSNLPATHAVPPWRARETGGTDRARDVPASASGWAGKGHKRTIMTRRIKQKGKEDLRRRGGKRRWMGNGQDGNVDG